MNLEFCRQITKQYSHIKFHENTSRGNRAAPCGQTDEQTDRHGEGNSCFSQLRTRLKRMWIYTCSGRSTRHTGSLFRSTDFHTNKRMIASFCIRKKGRKFVISLNINISSSSTAAGALTQLVEYIKWIFCLSSFSSFSSTPLI